jgi:hypothetical protein
MNLFFFVFFCQDKYKRYLLSCMHADVFPATILKNNKKILNCFFFSTFSPLFVNEWLFVMKERCYFFFMHKYNMPDVDFPVKEDIRKEKDREKPWLNDPEVKVIVREKGELYSRKVKGQEREGDRERLAELTKEVNRTRQRSRRAYFSQRIKESQGHLGGPGGSVGW